VIEKIPLAGHNIAALAGFSFRQKDNRSGCSQQRIPSMCDYSLHNVASRSAKIGDRLVSTRFPNSITGGFASVDEPNVAVCLLPGTELAFEENVAHERTYGLIFPRSEVVISGQNVARFRQVNLDQPHAHHDALEFPDGQIVLVTILREGQRATVIQMPAKPHPEAERADETEEEQPISWPMGV
jgi:hypothetical protein